MTEDFRTPFPVTDDETPVSGPLSTGTRHPRISAIAAMGSDGTIGKDNKIPWDIPEDMAFLRETTRGKPLIMGRSTYESVHGYRHTDPKSERAMPGRFNVLVTGDRNYFNGSVPDGVGLAASPQSGLQMAFDYAVRENIDEIFVFGGATIYQALMDRVERLYLTVIDRDYHGDSFFPEFNKDEWKLASNVRHDENNGRPSFSFRIYDRIRP